MVPRDEAITVVLPAYNERENIGQAVANIQAALQLIGREYEVIIVDDGSSDGTGEICDRISKKEPDRIRVIRHQKNMGYGASLRDGFRQAKYGLIFYTDSDNQFDVLELRYLLPLVDSYDIVVGFRIFRKDTRLRKFTSWVYNRLIARPLFKLHIRDINCAFKLIKKEALDKIDIESNNFFIDLELLAKARGLGFEINEVGVRHFPRLKGQSTVQPSDIPRTIKETIRIWRSLHSKKKR
jgi:dolichol-phosphate mannosyltransferase